jgi:hypothetical protein
MSVSGISGSDLSTLDTTNIQAENPLYTEDSQVLAETVGPANPSPTSGLALLQPVSPLLNAAPTTLSTVENAQGGSGTAALSQSGRKPASPSTPASVPSTGSGVQAPAMAGPLDVTTAAETTLLETFQEAIQSEAQQAYATTQEGDPAGDEPASPLGSLLA